MSVKFSDGVRHLYIPSINTVTSCKYLSTRDWLRLSNDFIISNVDYDVFEVNLYQTEDILNAIASDINRLSTAALGSLFSIECCNDPNKFLAWRMIKYYYSSFFSAHSLLKTLGFGLTQIDDNTLSSIRNKSRASGITAPNLHAGIYCFDLPPNPCTSARVS